MDGFVEVAGFDVTLVTAAHVWGFTA